MRLEQAQMQTKNENSKIINEELDARMKTLFEEINWLLIKTVSIVLVISNSSSFTQVKYTVTIL